MTETRYTPELAAEVIYRISNGESLRALCRDHHMPSESTIRNWVSSDIQGFADEYHQAQLLRIDCLADEILCVAYDRDIEPADKRVITENLRWLLSKVAPTRYGERLLLAGSISDPIRVLHEQVSLEALSPEALDALESFARSVLRIQQGGA